MAEGHDRPLLSGLTAGLGPSVDTNPGCTQETPLFTDGPTLLNSQVLYLCAGSPAIPSGMFRPWTQALTWDRSGLQIGCL